MRRYSGYKASAVRYVRLKRFANNVIKVVIRLVLPLAIGLLINLYSSATTESKVQKTLAQAKEEEIADINAKWEKKYNDLEDYTMSLANENLRLKESEEKLLTLQAAIDAQTNQELLSRDSETRFAEAISPSQEDIDLFERVIQAEFVNASLEAKMMGANVVINRISLYKQTLRQVLLSPNQFSVVANGTAQTAKPDKNTKEAVTRILLGERVFEPDVEFFWADYLSKNHWLWTREIVAESDETFFGKDP